MIIQDPDIQWVNAARAGSREAFGKLVSQYYDMVYAVVYGILSQRENALDAAQEVFLKAFRELEHFLGKSKFKTWLYRIAVNTAIDQQRKQRPARSIDATDASDDENEAPLVLVDPKQDPSEETHRRDLKETVEKALLHLAADHRAILVLREWQGLSYEEIAETLEIEIGTVMSRLFYARKRLSEVLGEKIKREMV